MQDFIMPYTSALARINFTRATISFDQVPLLAMSMGCFKPCQVEFRKFQGDEMEGEEDEEDDMADEAEETDVGEDESEAEMEEKETEEMGSEAEKGSLISIDAQNVEDSGSGRRRGKKKKKKWLVKKSLVASKQILREQICRNYA